ncbi:ComF family protein [Streptomyces sp. NPDC052701]|uniref:ComF family protein n=1 Tax=Streptomyces sp. NPDC052701 TaxID=3155533 RepID=UPI003446760F
MRGWWQDLTDLVLPAECAGCGRPRAVLCPECRAILSGAAPRRVRPVPEPPGLPAVHAAARYAHEARAVLLAHKERGATALSGPLGAALAGAVRAGLTEAGTRGGGAGPAGAVEARAGVGGSVPAGEGAVGGAWVGRGGARAVSGGVTAGDGGGAAGRPEETVLLVPVPSARRAVRARGHDPARRIALAAAGELRRGGTPARVLAVLRQRRRVADQVGLNSRQRLANLAGALTVAPGGARLLLGGPVVLVDDLMTTGASLAEAARAVRAATRERSQASSHARATGAGTAGTAAGRGGTGPIPNGSAAGLVYMGETWEGREERRSGDVICAAVVAAPPDAFEMIRN